MMVQGFWQEPMEKLTAMKTNETTDEVLTMNKNIGTSVSQL